MLTPAAWLRKVRRRKPGIYLVRTDRHMRRGRENGYVGLSNSWELRRECHLGKCRHQAHFAKPWTDLNPVWHCKTLPWWLGWRWLLEILETLAIYALMPRYNVSKNRWNPRRISPWQQRDQRARRNRARMVLGNVPHRFRPPVVLKLTGAACILLGITMTIVSNIR
jgi:hypothetical protein